MRGFPVSYRSLLLTFRAAPTTAYTHPSDINLALPVSHGDQGRGNFCLLKIKEVVSFLRIHTPYHIVQVKILVDKRVY